MALRDRSKRLDKRSRKAKQGLSKLVQFVSGTRGSNHEVLSSATSPEVQLMEMATGVVPRPSGDDKSVDARESGMAAREPAHLSNEATRSTFDGFGHEDLEPTNKSMPLPAGAYPQDGPIEVVGHGFTHGPLPSGQFKMNVAIISATLPKIKRGPHDDPIDIARLRLEELKAYAASVDPDKNPRDYNNAKREVHKADVDYNYCLYYPHQKMQWNPPPASLQVNPSDNKLQKLTTKWKYALWHLVEESMENETLNQVKNGKLVAAKIPQDVYNKVSKASKVSRGPPKSRQPPETGPKSAKNRNQDTMSPVEVESSSEVSSRSPEGTMVINVGDIAGQDTRNQEDGDITEKEYRKEAPRSQNSQMQPTEVPNGIELSNSGSEDGEVAEHAPQSEAGDASSNQVSSVGLMKESIGSSQPPCDGSNELRASRQALKDLSPDLLNKQIRYFHIGKLLDEVDLNLPAKCLACGGTWHNADDCAALRCGKCGVYNKHLTIRCPAKPKCPKCREEGHGESSCPYKLRTLSLDEITCDLCQQRGHVEIDCELIWRTSGKTWSYDVLDRGTVLLFCYECGKEGHLGNDCSTRRPGKGLGSSSWTVHQKFDAPLLPDRQTSYLTVSEKSRAKQRLRKRAKTETGMKIKGQAMNQAALLPDRDAFLHPRKQQPDLQPQQGRKQMMIHINPGAGMGIQRDQQPPPAALPYPPNQSVSFQQPFGGYSVPKQPASQFVGPSDYQQAYNSNVSEADQAAFVRYNHGNPSYDGQHERRQRDRSRSPLRGFSNRDYRGDRYQPGQPLQPPRPPARGFRRDDSYRPMPSAARDAFRRHKL